MNSKDPDTGLLLDATPVDSAQLYRLIVENTTDYAIFTADLSGLVTSWNAGAERLLGYREEDIIGRNGRIIFTPEDQARGAVEAEIRGALTDGRAVDNRWHVRRDGTRFWTNGLMMPLRDDAGRARGLLKILRDCTEQRRHDEVLRTSEERLRLATRSAAIGIWELEPATGTLRWDARCKALFGLSPEAAVSYETFLEGLHPKDREAVQADVERALDPAGSGVFDAEYRTVGIEDGVERWVAAAGQVLRDDERGVRFIGTVHDVTGRKRTEALLRQAVEHQRMLTQEASHRVKNSLQLVASVLSLQARGATAPEVRHALEEAEARVVMLAQMHDRLWQQDDVLSVDLSSLLGALCTDLAAVKQGCHVVFDAPDGPVPTPTDQAVPVALIVNELVTNALKYAYGDGVGVGVVSVRLDVADGIRLEVSDHGVGLPDGFDPEQRGSSLGMRLITGLTRQLGGRLTVAPTAPGACFLLEFPLSPARRP